jgi:hypothetical protein
MALVADTRPFIELADLAALVGLLLPVPLPVGIALVLGSSFYRTFLLRRVLTFL